MTASEFTSVEAITQWRLRIAESKPLFRDAWQRRAYLTFADAVACQSQGTTPLPEAWDHFAPRNDRLAR
jgi:hypothetical protein